MTIMMRKQFPLRIHILLAWLMLVTLMVKISHTRAADNVNKTENKSTADDDDANFLVITTTEKILMETLEHYRAQNDEIQKEYGLLVQGIDEQIENVKILNEEGRMTKEQKLDLYHGLSTAIPKALEKSEDTRNKMVSARRKFFEMYEKFRGVTPLASGSYNESEKVIDQFIKKLKQLDSIRIEMGVECKLELLLSKVTEIEQTSRLLAKKFRSKTHEMEEALENDELTADIRMTFREAIHDLVHAAKGMQADIMSSRSHFDDLLEENNHVALVRSEDFKMSHQDLDRIFDELESFRKEVTDTYCMKLGLLNEIVFDMVEYSSPQGSMSYNKLHRILNQASSFYVNLGVPIFDDVAKNVATMLKGYGLQQETSPMNRNDVIHIEASVKPRSVADGCTESPRIKLPRLSNCIVWEFSDYNYEWEKRHGLSDSVVLIPILIQTRLTTGLEVDFTDTKPLNERSLDVVFFAYMLERRLQLRQEIIDKHPDWNIQFEDNSQIQAMVKAYRDAKVCLVAHAYHSKSGGEYHRLSELATFGCIPVMEEFSDSIAIDDYALCGGVVFAPYESLTETVSTVLQDIDANERDYTKHAEWWRRGIHWDSILLQMFDEDDEVEILEEAVAS